MSINLRTWQTLCGIAFPLAFVGLAVGIITQDSPTATIAATVAGWVIGGLGIVGAILGVLFLLSRLSMRCPLCDAISRVIGGTGKEIHVDCPSCGQVCSTMRWLRTPVTEVVEPTDIEA